MDKKIEGVLIGLAGVVLWFAPFAEWNEEFMGQFVYYQVAGNDIGGIAYLLLLASFAQCVFSWLSQPHLRAISACLALFLCLIIFYRAGSSISWGLISLIFFSGYGAVSAKYEINELTETESTSKQ